MLSSSLAAGYSMENSFAQAQAQLEEMYGERGMMSKEFAVMRSQLSMNRTLEELWGDFAKRSGIEEIRSFAQIFKAARRSGGQLGMIISHVSEIIGGEDTGAGGDKTYDSSEAVRTENYESAASSDCIVH